MVRMQAIIFFVQLVIGWLRDVLVGILGSRCEEIGERYTKRKRRRRWLARRGRMRRNGAGKRIR